MGLFLTQIFSDKKRCYLNWNTKSTMVECEAFSPYLFLFKRCVSMTENIVKYGSCTNSRRQNCYCYFPYPRPDFNKFPFKAAALLPAVCLSCKIYGNSSHWNELTLSDSIHPQVCSFSGTPPPTFLVPLVSHRPPHLFLLFLLRFLLSCYLYLLKPPPLPSFCLAFSCFQLQF